MRPLLVDEMKKRLVHLILGVAAGSMSIFAEPAPSANEILAQVRSMQAQQQIEVQGQLRQNDIVIPFRLLENGPAVRYTFSNPEETLELKLGEEDSTLEQLSDGNAKKIAQFNEKVRGTDISYEDLALKFLYWSRAEVLGRENVRTRDCWKLRLRAPSKKSSQYSNVLLWIDRNSGALMRMEGYDWDGKLAKKFEVVSAQKIDNRWFLKQMRIETLQPGTKHVQSRTYLEIKR
jgi:hypothetical protein